MHARATFLLFPPSVVHVYTCIMSRCRNVSSCALLSWAVLLCFVGRPVALCSVGDGGMFALSVLWRSHALHVGWVGGRHSVAVCVLCSFTSLVCPTLHWSVHASPGRLVQFGICWCERRVVSTFGGERPCSIIYISHILTAGEPYAVGRLAHCADCGAVCCWCAVVRCPCDSCDRPVLAVAPVYDQVMRAGCTTFASHRPD